MTLPPLLCKVKEHPTPQWGQITGVFWVFHGPGLVKAGTLLLLRAPVGADHHAQATAFTGGCRRKAAGGKDHGFQAPVEEVQGVAALGLPAGADTRDRREDTFVRVIGDIRVGEV